MTWKNIIENSIQLILVFVGLGLYTELVLKDILIESIKTETTKIENNIKTEIDNKFKKVGEVVSNLPLSIEPSNVQEIALKPITSEDCEVSKSEYDKLSDGEKRRLSRWLKD